MTEILKILHLQANRTLNLEHVEKFDAILGYTALGQWLHMRSQGLLDCQIIERKLEENQETQEWGGKREINADRGRVFGCNYKVRKRP